MAAYNYLSKNSTLSNMTDVKIFGLHGKECWVGEGPDVIHYMDSGPTYDCHHNMAVYIFVDQGTRKA